MSLCVNLPFYPSLCLRAWRSLLHATTVCASRLAMPLTHAHGGRWFLYRHALLHSYPSTSTTRSRMRAVWCYRCTRVWTAVNYSPSYACPAKIVSSPGGSWLAPPFSCRPSDDVSSSSLFFIQLLFVHCRHWRGLHSGGVAIDRTLSSPAKTTKAMQFYGCGF